MNNIEVFSLEYSVQINQCQQIVNKTYFSFDSNGKQPCASDSFYGVPVINIRYGSYVIAALKFFDVWYQKSIYCYPAGNNKTQLSFFITDVITANVKLYISIWPVYDRLLLA